MASQATVAVVLTRAWFDWYCRWALRRWFHRVMLFGETSPLPGGEVGVCNHASFWDGIVLSHVLRDRLGVADLRCLIDAEQVARHPFFDRVGGITLDRQRPRQGLREAADRLAAGASVVVFPQGKIVHPDARPMGFERGAALLGRRFPVRPMALRYGFWEEQRPEAMLAVGDALPVGTTLPDIEAAVTVLADDLAAADREWQVGEVVLTGRPGVSRWKETWGRGV